MIGLLAAAALLAGAQADPSPAEMGRAAVYVGVCSSLGWDGSGATAYAREYDVRNPTDDMPARVAEMEAAVQDARAEFIALIADFRRTGDAAALRNVIVERCDALVRDIPGMLRRTGSTDDDFEAAFADLLAIASRNSGAN